MKRVPITKDRLVSTTCFKEEWSLNCYWLLWLYTWIVLFHCTSVYCVLLWCHDFFTQVAMTFQNGSKLKALVPFTSLVWYLATLLICYWLHAPLLAEALTWNLSGGAGCWNFHDFGGISVMRWFRESMEQEECNVFWLKLDEIRIN